MKQISDPGGGLLRPRTWNIGSHEDFQKRYVRLTSAVIRKISENKPQNCKKNRRRKKIILYKKTAKKCLFLHKTATSKRSVFEENLYAKISLKWLSTHENLSPLWESRILAYGLDINQRTLNLKFFEWPFFSDAWIAAVGWPFCQFSPRPLFSHCFHEIFILRTSAFLYCGFLLQHAKQPKCYLYNSFEIYTPLSAFFICVLAFVWPLLLG